MTVHSLFPPPRPGYEARHDRIASYQATEEGKASERSYSEPHVLSGYSMYVHAKRYHAAFPLLRGLGTRLSLHLLSHRLDM